MQAPGKSVAGFVLFLVLQIIFVIVFAVLGRYGKGLLPATGVHDGAPEEETSLSKYPREFTQLVGLSGGPRFCGSRGVTFR